MLFDMQRKMNYYSHITKYVGFIKYLTEYLGNEYLVN